MTRLRAIMVLVASLLIASTACSQEPPPRPPAAAPSPSPTESSTAPQDPWREGRPVTFQASDGVEIVGAVFGNGPVSVALAHMGRPTDNGTHWMPAAKVLARRGYEVLVFNRRGVCIPDSDVCSGSEDYYDRHWKDVVGAVNFLRSEGAKTVVVGGASLGAMASLHAATRPNVEVDGVVWFGGLLGGNVYDFTPKTVGRLDAPMLLVSTKDDAYNAVEALKPLKRWAGGSARIVILPGSAHGTDVFSSRSSAARRGFLDALLDYLKGLSE